MCRSKRKEQKTDVWSDKKDTTVGEKIHCSVKILLKKFKLKINC